MQRPIQFILLFLTAVSHPFALQAQIDAIMVDEPQAEFTGSWQTIKESASVGVSPTFRYAMNVEADATATAIFRPKVPATGKYHVEIASTPGRNRSPKVPCVISCADGEISVVMDQTQKPGGWHRVAENLQFNAGTSGFIMIRNNGGELGTHDKIVIADAVRLVPSGEGAAGGFQLLTTVGNGGQVVSKPNKKTFEPNSSVTLTAEANDGFVFDGWSGDVNSSANPLTLTMDKTIRLTANFSEGNPGAILTAEDATFVGVWQTNAAKWGARTNYQFASTCSRDGVPGPLSTAVYQPQLSKSGLYDIYIWYSKGTNRADNAPWEIVGKGKPFVVKVNQQVNGGDWVPIANAVEFDSGKKGYVKLSNLTGTVNSVVVADSVAFVYVGKP